MSKRLCALPLACALAIAMASAAHGFSSEIASRALFDGEFGGVTASCEGGVVLGGGFDPEELQGFAPRWSGPTALGSGPTVPLDWRAELGNATGLAGLRSFRVAALCGEVDGVMLQSGTIAGGQSVSTGIATCPAGHVALGAAFGFQEIGYLPFAPLAPPEDAGLHGLSFVFDTPGPDLSLGQLAAGTYDAPYAVSVSAQSSSSFDDPNPAPPVEDVILGGVVLVAAICAPADAADVVVIVTEGTAAPESVGSRTALCPDGYAAVGGGVERTSGINTGVEVRSSGPLYFGFPFSNRLFAMGDGDASSPIGWRAVLDNPYNDTADFRVAAICVPEASSVASAACAALALAAVRRRRRAASDAERARRGSPTWSRADGSSRGCASGPDTTGIRGSATPR